LLAGENISCFLTAFSITTEFNSNCNYAAFTTSRKE
jgi:hypothetical protein